MLEMLAGKSRVSGPLHAVTQTSDTDRLCQLSRLLIDDVSAILPRAQAASRMPSAIAALRMCCQRRLAAGTCWRMRDPIAQEVSELVVAAATPPRRSSALQSKHRSTSALDAGDPAQVGCSDSDLSDAAHGGRALCGLPWDRHRGRPW